MNREINIRRNNFANIALPSFPQKRIHLIHPLFSRLGISISIFFFVLFGSFVVKSLAQFRTLLDPIRHPRSSILDPRSPLRLRSCRATRSATSPRILSAPPDAVRGPGPAFPQESPSYPLEPAGFGRSLRRPSTYRREILRASR